MKTKSGKSNYRIVISWDIGAHTKEDAEKALGMYLATYKTSSNTIELVKVD